MHVYLGKCKTQMTNQCTTNVQFNFIPNFHLIFQVLPLLTSRKSTRGDPATYFLINLLSHLGSSYLWLFSLASQRCATRTNISHVTRARHFSTVYGPARSLSEVTPSSKMAKFLSDATSTTILSCRTSATTLGYPTFTKKN